METTSSGRLVELAISLDEPAARAASGGGDETEDQSQRESSPPREFLFNRIEAARVEGSGRSDHDAACAAGQRTTSHRARRGGARPQPGGDHPAAQPGKCGARVCSK